MINASPLEAEYLNLDNSEYLKKENEKLKKENEKLEATLNKILEVENGIILKQVSSWKHF